MIPRVVEDNIAMEAELLHMYLPLARKTDATARPVVIGFCKVMVRSSAPNTQCWIKASGLGLQPKDSASWGTSGVKRLIPI